MFRRYKNLIDQINKQNQKIEKLEGKLAKRYCEIIALQFFIENPSGYVFKNTFNSSYIKWQYKFFDKSKIAINSIDLEVSSIDKKFEYEIKDSINEDKTIIENKTNGKKFLICKSKKSCIQIDDIIDLS